METSGSDPVSLWMVGPLKGQSHNTEMLRRYPIFPECREIACMRVQVVLYRRSPLPRQRLGTRLIEPAERVREHVTHSAYRNIEIQTWRTG